MLCQISNFNNTCWKLHWFQFNFLTGCCTIFFHLATLNWSSYFRCVTDQNRDTRYRNGIHVAHRRDPSYDINDDEESFVFAFRIMNWFSLLCLLLNISKLIQFVWRKIYLGQKDNNARDKPWVKHFVYVFLPLGP